MASRRSVQQLASGLGWFSLGLGATQMVAPGLVNRMIGVRDDAQSRFWQRFVAVQELSAAGGILGRLSPENWLRGRTAADVVHIGMVTRARSTRGERPGRLTATLLSLAGVSVLDAYASSQFPTTQESDMSTTTTITVRDDREAVQRKWREFVSRRDDGLRLGPLEITDEALGQRTKWRAADSADVQVSGEARFTEAPGSRGTELHLQIDEDGSIIEKIKGETPRQRAADDLRHFKQLVETGVVARSEGAQEGSDARRQPIQSAAQPHGTDNR